MNSQDPKLNELVAQAKNAFLEKNIQKCCELLDEAVEHLKAQGVDELPDEIMALTAACVASDKATLEEAAKA